VRLPGFDFFPVGRFIHPGGKLREGPTGPGSRKEQRQCEQESMHGGVTRVGMGGSRGGANAVSEHGWKCSGNGPGPATPGARTAAAV